MLFHFSSFQGLLVFSKNIQVNGPEEDKDITIKTMAMIIMMIIKDDDVDKDDDD